MSYKVLVTGGAGYIGSHMVLALQDAGYTPIVFDNLSRGHANAVPPGVPLLVGDLRSQEALDACFNSHAVDLVMHFAALAYVGESVLEPESYYDNNVIGALNLLSAMRRHGLQRLVFSSTCATYGNPATTPITELHPQRPINPYGRTKFLIEQALQDYGSAYGFESIALRYFNAAGADHQGRATERHAPETHLIPLVLREAARIREGGDPQQTQLNVFGDDFETRDGTCVRDYIHVTDLCDAHLKAAERLLAGMAPGAQAYNLANGQGFTVREVIEACRDITGQPIQYRIQGRRAGDPAELVGDATRALQALGWQPRMTQLKDIVQSAWQSQGNLNSPFLAEV